ncbi:class I SAM-dependent methyltransferase [Streptomyces abyssomicinicus]|uniref:class I SAM-dependent methyltransferase n=1 Tax=Streptomyces abyssomicinicus TaxID=574929 RepID=UPI0012501164|nr:class I SAM-dependent methyltransferase [Streptomyces abyssomicinicus]
MSGPKTHGPGRRDLSRYGPRRYGPQGPTLGGLAVQALSSVERGYDLLAPDFDHTPFRTPDGFLRATRDGLAPLGPFEDGLDLCCGTGAGLDVTAALCRRSVTGVDVSAGMLERARRAAPRAALVRADARALPFAPASFDLAVTFGALGHFLPRDLPALFGQAHRVLRPGGRLAFPLPGPPRPGSRAALGLLAFDTAMRVRNAVWRPPFVMYYRVLTFGVLRSVLVRTGFTVETYAMAEFGRREDGSPRCRLVVATRPTRAAQASGAAGTSPGPPAL